MRISRFAAILSGMFIAVSIQTFAAVDVEITIDAGKPVRELDKNYIGSGAEHYDYYFGSAIKNKNSVQAIKDMNLKWLRFPNGTSAQFYLWDKPMQSYSPHKNKFALSSSDILTACKQMGLEPVFQINTYQFRGKSGSSFEDSKVLLAPGNISQAADYAARWVRLLKGRVSWWEIGNEDWIYWTGQQYAVIANKFAKYIKKANPKAKTIIQGFVGRYDGKFNSADADTWMPDLLNNADPDLFDAISLHLYLSGQIPGRKNETFEQQTASMLAAVDFSKDLEKVCREVKQTNPKWQLWVTEFNAFQKDEEGPGGIMLMQNISHGLVVCDWIGKMLEMGVDRMSFHALTGHPCFQFIDVGKWTTPDDPHYTVPGLAIMAFSKYFSGELLKTQVKNNVPQLKADFQRRMHKVKSADIVSHSYDPVSAYAAMDAARGKLTVILINRNLENKLSVCLKLNGLDGKISDNIMMKTLGEGLDITANNITKYDTVQWHERVVTAKELKHLILSPATINVINIPLNK
ncbi:hypothetical protein JXO59_01540 [candidate division KSB1 bacterium]|nr:hypothetical protein [candidate division KSB1 bacterium]